MFKNTIPCFFFPILWFHNLDGTISAANLSSYIFKKYSHLRFWKFFGFIEGFSKNYRNWVLVKNSNFLNPISLIFQTFTIWFNRFHSCKDGSSKRIGTDPFNRLQRLLDTKIMKLRKKERNFNLYSQKHFQSTTLFITLKSPLSWLKVDLKLKSSLTILT